MPPDCSFEPLPDGGTDDEVDTLVIGAGVVGLACARALALGGRNVWVLEAAAGIGSGVSARSSEVIHAGLYYPTGSLKARWCVRGRHLLYDYAARRGIGHRRCGKLVVATEAAQLATLQAIARQGEANGVEDLRLIDGVTARAMEPALRACGALHSPHSGIVDSHALMLALQGDLEAAGGSVVLRSRVQALQVRPGGGARVIVRDSAARPGADAPPTVLGARWVVNAAGLQAVGLARSLALALTPAPAPAPAGARALPSAHFARGRYFTLARRAPFERLIYPVPEPGGLGVHLTLDLAGQARFGPDVQWMASERDASPEAIDAFDYSVDPALRSRFEAEVRAYWPGLPEHSLQPAYSGIRPKLSGPGEPAADFRVDGPEEHGHDGVLHLLGIESPGLTSALAIGEAVAARVAERESRAAAHGR